MQRSHDRQLRPRELLLSRRALGRLHEAHAGDSGAAPATSMAGRQQRRPSARRAAAGHSLAWLAWAGGASAAIWLVSNPLYLIIILLVAVVVFLSCARQDALARSFNLFFILGAFLLLLQLFFSIVTAGDLRGRTLLIELPEVRLPALLGGIVLGGRVTAEQLAWGAMRGLRLWAVLLVFGAFNASVNHYRLLRRVPAFLFHGSLIITIALALVPQTIMRLQSIREAQQLRGHRFRGLRDALPLLVPLLAGGLERSLSLAEAMEARGYGQISAAAQKRPASGRVRVRQLMGIVAPLLLVLGAFAFFYHRELRSAGIVLLCLGGLLLVMELRRLSRLVSRTRYSRERWRRRDVAVALLALAVPWLLVAMRAHGIEFDYAVFPRLMAPAFQPIAGACLLLLVAPALLLPASRL